MCWWPQPNLEETHTFITPKVSTADSGKGAPITITYGHHFDTNLSDLEGVFQKSYPSEVLGYITQPKEDKGLLLTCIHGKFE